MEPDGSFVVEYPPDWLALAVFVIVSLLISWIVERLEQAQSRLHRAEVERRAELERMVAERTAELSASRQREQGLIQSAMDAIVAIDDSHRIVLFNPAAERMFGCPNSEALGSSIDRFIPSGSARHTGTMLRAFGATGSDIPSKGAPPDWCGGCTRTARSSPSRPRSPGCLPAGRGCYTVILRDISERMTA